MNRRQSINNMLLLLLSRFSRVRLCTTLQTAAHQAPPSLGFSRQEHGVGRHFLLQCMKVKRESEVAQSCPTLRDPVDCSLPGSSVHGILQARILEWGCYFLLQGLFPTPGSNPHPLYWQASCLENPMNSTTRQKDQTLKDELAGEQVPNMLLEISGEIFQKEWRDGANTKTNPVVDVTVDESKAWCYKQQYCTGTWNVRSMNQGELEVVKQEMARVYINILGITELRRTGMGDSN